MSSDAESQPLLHRSIQTPAQAGKGGMWALLRTHPLTVHVTAFAVCALLVVVGLVTVGWSFSAACADPCALAYEYEGCLSSNHMFAVFLVFFFGPLSVFVFGSLMIEVGHARLPAELRRMLYVGLGLVALIATVLSFQILVRPKHETVHNDVLLVLIGGFIATAFLPMCALCLLLAGPFTKPSFLQNHPERSLTASTWSANSFGIGITLVVLFLAAFCDSTFSSVWNFSARSYFRYASPYNLLPHSVAYVNGHFQFKLYEDVVIFFSVIGVLVVLGVASHLVPSVRRAVSRRVPIRVPYLFEHGASLGELFMLAAIFTLYVVWVWFWRWHYPRIVEETKISAPFPGPCCGKTMADTCPDLPMTDEFGNWQTWARVLGHVSTLTFSLAVVPATRNSVLVSCFGIPFERSIRYHRALGFLSWFFVTVHMVIWQLKWAKEGTLWNNVITIDNLKISRAQVCWWSSASIHWDNFTVLLTETAWLMATVMVVLALLVRRTRYELFYYAHQAAIFFLVAAASHAWAFWYYAAAGMILWFVDRLIRISNASNEVTVLEVKAVGDVTCLTLANSTLRNYCAQYAWLSFPEIDPFWHPFTISSAPSHNFTSFHIKSMGPGTFTDELLEAARKRSLAVRTVRVDGPYGRPQYFDQCKTIVLLAGGIGFTPMHSILAELAANNLQNCGSIQRVLVWWCIRSRALLDIEVFAETLHKASEVKNIEVNVHMTREDKNYSRGELGHESIAYLHDSCKEGRPELKSALSLLPPGQDTMVMVCGPQGLVSMASQLSFENDFAFHSEEFYF